MPVLLFRVLIDINRKRLTDFSHKSCTKEFLQPGRLPRLELVMLCLSLSLDQFWLQERSNFF